MILYRRYMNAIRIPPSWLREVSYQPSIWFILHIFLPNNIKSGQSDQFVQIIYAVIYLAFEIDLIRDLTVRKVADDIDASYEMKTVTKTRTPPQADSLLEVSYLVAELRELRKHHPSWWPSTLCPELEYNLRVIRPRSSTDRAPDFG